MKKARHSFVPAVYLVLEDAKGALLLLKRAHTGYRDGFYSLVAGHIEPGESPSEALIREAFEEAGLLLCSKDLELQHIMTRFNAARLDYFFKATRWKGTLCNREPEKCAELAFYPPDAFPTPIIPFVQKALLLIRSGQFSSEDKDEDGPFLAAVS
jgi:8-oxo-dGTP pyrophosphatase MutT (NUDIX family)